MSKFKYRDLATSMTAFFFFVIGISGVMMYFHFFDDYVKELHEILGLVFVAVVFTHVYFHIKSFKSYFGKKVFTISAVVVLGISAMFVVNTPEGENPKKTLIISMLDAPIESSAKVLNLDMQTLKERLKTNGIKISSSDVTISSIAKDNSISPFELVTKITQK